MELISIAAIKGSSASSADDTIAILLLTEDREEVILVLSGELAAGLLIAVADAGADSEMQRGEANAPIHAEGFLLTDSEIAGQQLLTVRVEGGLNVRFLVPKPESSST